MSNGTVLAIGAHPDDIEFGCGGTLLKLKAAGWEVGLVLFTLGERDAEQEEAEKLLLPQHSFRFEAEDTRVDERQAVDDITVAIETVEPSLIISHYPFDTHQDHRAVGNATLAASRYMSRVLCYCSFSSIGFTPSVFVDINGYLSYKLEMIGCHKSQISTQRDLIGIAQGMAYYNGMLAKRRVCEGFWTYRYVLEV